MCIIVCITSIVGTLGGIAGIASAIYTWIFQRKTNKREEAKTFFVFFNAYLKAAEKDNIGNGFMFLEHRKRSEEKQEHMELYHAIKTEAHLYLTILNLILEEKEVKYKEIYAKLLRPYVTINRAQCYYCYLFITDQFPELLKRKEELKQKGFFKLPMTNWATKMTDKYLEDWGKNMRKHLQL